MGEKDVVTGSRVFPQLSGLNWPSYLLQAWRTLDALGVPAESIRLVPEIGHFAVPEVSAQEPPGPAYDALTGRLTVHRVDPAVVRPRLTVSVRAETVQDVDPVRPDAPPRERVVGRLAHFLPPLLAGLPGGIPADPLHDPLGALTGQVCAQYPELMAALSEADREALEVGADDLLAFLAPAGDPEHQAAIRDKAARRVAEPERRTACRRAWRLMAGKLAPPPPVAGETTLGETWGEAEAADLAAHWDAALRVFGQWTGALFGPDPDAAALDPAWDGVTPAEAARQRALLRALLSALSFENARERTRVVREMMEIVSTEAFLASAVIDSLAGIGWIHGRISDVALEAEDVPEAVPMAGRGAARAPLDGWFLSVTGGWNGRALVASRLARWAEAGEVLGAAPDALAGLDEAERMQLWSLVAWRREAADAFVLFETAAQRLVHPDVVVRPARFAPALSRPGTLMAQPGRTATLGGAALLLYPGVVVEVPLEDGPEADQAALQRARDTLGVLVRLFLPVSCRLEVLWRTSAARLDRPSYLRHEFQAGTRLVGAGAVADAGPGGDPITL